jgi:acyl carrier protein
MTNTTNTPARPETESEKLEFLQHALSKLFDKNFKVFLDDNLSDLDIDSLDSVELQINFEETYGVQLPDTNKPIVTVRDLINLM